MSRWDNLWKSVLLAFDDFSCVFRPIPRCAGQISKSQGHKIENAYSAISNQLYTIFSVIFQRISAKLYLYMQYCYTLLNILEGKRNAYFDFQNVGFILRTDFVLIPAIYTHWYRQLNSFTNFFNFCWWRIQLDVTSLPRIGVHRLCEGNQSSKTNHFRRKWIAE